jgi:hypothetical protein
VTSRFRRARLIRRRLTDVPFATVLAVLGINGTITFFTRPGAQAASLLASPLDYAWIGMYGAGGALIFAGIATARVSLEAAGCVAFGTGAAVSGLATAVVRGWPQWNAVAVLFVFAGAAATRAYHLFRGRVLVLLDVAAGTLRDAR